MDICLEKLWGTKPLKLHNSFLLSHHWSYNSSWEIPCLLHGTTDPDGFFPPHQGWLQPNWKQQQTKLKEKRGQKQSTKKAAMWAEQPRKSDLLWILLAEESWRDKQLSWCLPLQLGFPSASFGRDSLKWKRWTYSAVSSSMEAIRNLYSLSGCYGGI